MVESLVNSIIALFGNFSNAAFGKEIIVFIISMLPILELRGGLLAAALLKLNPIVSYIICIIGNVIPIPIILLFITKIFDKLKKCRVNLHFFLLFRKDSAIIYIIFSSNYKFNNF